MMEEISLIIILISLVILIYSFLVTIKNNNYPKKPTSKGKNCILIPARNESKVIEDLLISIENQTQKIESKDVYVIPSNFGWDDVGNWEALDRYRDKDEAGNVLVGKSKAIKANNNLVISSNNSVVVDGLNDIYIIESDGKVLVGQKSNVANIKELKNIVL